MRRQFWLAYGHESQNSFYYTILVLCLFITVHVAFTTPCPGVAVGPRPQSA